MFAEWERDGLDSPKDLSWAMFNVALNVVSGAAFGVSLPWREDQTVVPKGHQHTFKKALQNMVESLRYYIITPKFLFKLPIASLQKLKARIDEFETYMKEFIQDAKDGKSKTQSNLLTALILSTSDTPDENMLTERELLGNMFIFLFAGHETTAGTLAYALASLALNPAVQQRLYEEIAAVCGSEELKYSQINSMPYTLAVLNETLRMYSPVGAIPKYVAKQTTLGKYVLPAGSYVNIHTFGAQYSEKTWGPTRFEFNPSRWFVDPDCGNSAQAVKQKSGEHSLKGFLHTKRYAFIPFSDGPRSCLGKRFAEVEFMTAIVSIIQKYEVQVPPGVSAEDLLEGKDIITFKTKNPVQLIVKKRA
ncbi:hypothetical protein HDV03_001074 [Kappamyces sp. JEL0829]|nr:hypothetical protein HDV03_001074 [Kappamyces sp. JEL0829]